MGYNDPSTTQQPLQLLPSKAVGIENSRFEQVTPIFRQTENRRFEYTTLFLGNLIF